MKRVRILVTGLLIVGLFIGLVNIALAEQTRKLVRIASSAPAKTDPAVGADDTGHRLMVNIYDPLLYPTPEGTTKPWVAESYEVSEDGLAYTFTIRRGITFHNGSELTASDVAFSANRLLAIGQGSAYLYLGFVKNAEVVDEYTVRFNMERKLGPFLNILPWLFILDEEEVMSHIEPGDYGEYGDYGMDWLLFNDAGSGPYKLKEHKPEEQVTLERFPEYWGGFAPSPPEEVQFLLGPSVPATLSFLFERRELEISPNNCPLEFYQALDEVEGIDLAVLYTGSIMNLQLNTKRPPTDCVHFRRYLNYLLDYATMMEHLFPYSERMLGPIPVNLAGCDTNIVGYSMDWEKALAELKQSKYYGQEITANYLYSEYMPRREKIGLMLALAAARVGGVNIKIDPSTWSESLVLAKSPETTPNIFPCWTSAGYAEAGAVLQMKYLMESPGSYEATEWLQDPEIDAMIKEALGTIDQQERFEKYVEIQQKIVDLAPDVFLAGLGKKYVYQAGYMDWPLSQNQIPLHGYNMNFSLVSVYPEKRAALLE